jgi:hypothetical protein
MGKPNRICRSDFTPYLCVSPFICGSIRSDSAALRASVASVLLRATRGNQPSVMVTLSMRGGSTGLDPSPPRCTGVLAIFSSVSIPPVRRPKMV